MFPTFTAWEKKGGVGAQSGAFDEKRLMLETHVSMRRAGADLIFTYFAADLACELAAARP